jgi:ornithine cyclodeaminase
MSVHVLREPQIREFLVLRETIGAVEKSFADYSAGRAVVPDVTNLDILEHQGEVHIKSAHIRGQEHYVVKIASGFYRNPELGLPVGNGLMMLFEAKTGRLACILFDNGYITEMRTAAAGAVCADQLALDPVESVGVVGSGSQARYQVKALFEVRAPKIVHVWSPHPEHVAAYVEEMTSLYPQVRFSASPSCQDAVSDSDLVITATPSRSPVVRAEWLKPGVHITALGSDGPEKQELDVEVLRVADKIFCDSRSQCARLGEVHHGLKAGVIAESAISGEIGDLILGRKRGRENDRQITVADLTGLGVQDAAAASLVYAKSLRRGVGDSIEI